MLRDGALLDLPDAVFVAVLSVSFNGVIDACGKGGEWQRSLVILQNMNKAGVAPNQVGWAADSKSIYFSIVKVIGRRPSKRKIVCVVSSVLEFIGF